MSQYGLSYRIGRPFQDDIWSAISFIVVDFNDNANKSEEYVVKLYPFIWSFSYSLSLSLSQTDTTTKEKRKEKEKRILWRQDKSHKYGKENLIWDQN